MTAPTTRPRAPWWITPAGALSLLIPVTLLLTWRLDDAAFRLFYRTGKSITDSTLLLTAVAALVLAGVATAAAVLAPRARRTLIPVRGVVPNGSRPRPRACSGSPSAATSSTPARASPTGWTRRRSCRP